jgi:hypothetical protein
MFGGPSPCLACTRVKDPKECRKVNCAEWSKWWREKWDATRLYLLPRLKQKEDDNNAD